MSDMSERGWREFLSADGIDDWVILHCIAAWPDGAPQADSNETG